MGLQLDSDLLDEVAHRLDLRGPNRDAIQSVVMRTSAHYDIAGKPSPFECIVDSATGVGKTFVMAGLIDYLAGAAIPARNFLVLAPGRTIRDKTVGNFTPGHPKSLTPAMKSRPYVITADTFATSAAREAMSNTSITKIYVFTVQALTSSTGEGRATHDFNEDLGTSFYQFLANLDDLVVLADEHHCYRGPAFSRTIANLNPELVVGLTATPAKADEDFIIYRYPLALAINHRLVKTPVVVARRDTRKDDETKLLDGVTLLRHKATVADAYCADNSLPRVNPVMLVIAKDIAEAERYQTILDSEAFDAGSWVGKTLLVHSGLTGDAKEQALADLDAVEDPDSRVRVIISVAQLKEGWDVKNVYVIASMRASASEVLTEQTLGRGLRLPFGRYTGIEMLDTVEVLAHERYSELLQKRDVLNEKFIDYRTYAEARTLADGRVEVRQRTEFVDEPVIGPQPGVLDEVASEASAVTGSGTTRTGHSTTTTTPPAQHVGMVDLEARTQEAAQASNQSAKAQVEFYPLAGREPIVLPVVRTTARKAQVSLIDIDTDDYVRFDRLGEALATSGSDELKRTKIVAHEVNGKIEVDTEQATDRIRAIVLDIPLDVSREMLVKRIMLAKAVPGRAQEVQTAVSIVDRLITAMGPDAATYLSAFGDTAARRLVEEVTKALGAASTGSVEYDQEVTTYELKAIRRTTRRQATGHADGSFNSSTAFNGWQRNLYSHAWFDSSPEFNAAAAIDDSESVIVWARLHINDLPITWTAEGRKYNPDFVVIEEVAGKRHGWLVETKSDKEMTTSEVVGKRRAARRWARIVNTSKIVPEEWGYLLLSETDVADANGNWSQMKAYGS